MTLDPTPRPGRTALKPTRQTPPAPRQTPTTRPKRHGAIGRDRHFILAMLAIVRLSTADAVATFRRLIDARAATGFYLEAEAAELRKLLELRAAILGRAVAELPTPEVLAPCSAPGGDSLPPEALPGALSQLAGGEA